MIDPRPQAPQLEQIDRLVVTVHTPIFAVRRPVLTLLLERTLER